MGQRRLKNRAYPEGFALRTAPPRRDQSGAHSETDLHASPRQHDRLLTKPVAVDRHDLADATVHGGTAMVNDLDDLRWLVRDVCTSWRLPLPVGADDRETTWNRGVTTSARNWAQSVSETGPSGVTSPKNSRTWTRSAQLDESRGLAVASDCASTRSAGPSG